ncbi:MAG: urea ABC transporter permease subunit UrtC, partial [Acetobacter papayae]
VTRAVLRVITGVVLALALMLSRFVVAGRFGNLLVAVRDAESRTRFLGYRPEQVKLLVWVFSAMLAGVGGALYVTQVGIINPGEFAPANSIESVIWVAVGGRGTLSGAVLGAVLVNMGKTVFTAWLPEFWLYGLGLLFLVTTLFLPKGVMGLFKPAPRKEAEDITPEVSSPEGDEA